MSETAASLTARKRALRAELQERLGGLSRARLRAASRAAAARLASTPWWREAQWVFAYMAMQAELQTRAIIRRALREGKAVAVPRIEGGEISFYTYEAAACRRTDSASSNRIRAGSRCPPSVCRGVHS